MFLDTRKIEVLCETILNSVIYKAVIVWFNVGARDVNVLFIKNNNI